MCIPSDEAATKLLCWRYATSPLIGAAPVVMRVPAKFKRQTEPTPPRYHGALRGRTVERDPLPIRPSR